MLDPGFLVISCGRLLIGFPANSVMGIFPWSDPRPLPGAAPWIAGLLPWEGGVLPVARTDFWRGDPEVPDVCAVLTLRGRGLAIPGRSPWLAARGPLSDAAVLGEGPWEGELRSGEKNVACVNVEKLYLALGLH